MRTSIAAALALALTGCVGGLEVEPRGGDDDTGADAGGEPVDTAEARALFDADVFPIMQAKCASCHSASGPVANVTGFVAVDPGDGYDTMIGYVALVGNFAPSAAGVLGKIEIGHNGVVYSPEEISSITAWLDKEVELRNGGGVTPDPNDPPEESPSEATARVLNEWSGCMSLDNFVQADMPEAWGDLNTENNQECENCHASGAEGFIASEQADIFFDTIASNKYYMLQYFTVDLTGGAAAAAMKINTVSFYGVSRGQDPHRQHPRFNAEDNRGMQALRDFYDRTVARKEAGGCDPTRLTN